VAQVKVKGNIVKARESFVKDNFGHEAWTKVVDALPDEDAQVLRGIVTNAAWFDFEMAKRLDDTIVATLGHGRREVFEDIGRASAIANLTTVHKRLLEPGDPQAFMEKADLIYGFYYDKGYRDYEATGANSGVLTTHEAQTYSQMDCLTVIGWYRQALEMCGASSVEIVEESCRALGGEVCRYVVSWK
jgi:hypothetical protein